MATESTIKKLARPALVIGLGGTGQWVLAYLKKDLLESYDGDIPDNVRLVGLDTMPISEGEVGQSGAPSQDKEETAHAGAVTLEEGKEFIYLGGDTYELAKHVNDGGHPHIGLWYRAKEWLGALRTKDFILDEGAGRNRQFGRLAISKDLLGGPVNSTLWRTLDSKITEIASVSPEKHIEIIIVGSFAGGTGSGMFIDMALLARRVAELSNLSVSLRGYFVLPKAFVTRDQKMMARTFAAWRELNRFMSLGNEIGAPNIVLAPEATEFDINLQRRLFDSCYLVDAVLGTEPLTEDPKNSIFPAIADAISTILDVDAGKAYVQKIEQNLNPIYADNPGQPMYGTLSTFTFKVPVYYNQQEYAHGLTRGMLTTLLAPRSDGRGGWTLAPDANLEPDKEGKTGASEALSILREDKVEYEGEVSYGNFFTKELADMALKADDGAYKQMQIDRMLQRVRSGTQAAGTWVSLFADIGNDPKEEQLKQMVNEEKLFSLAKALPTTEVAGSELTRRLEKIREKADEIITERYGVQTSEGETKGTYGKLLEQIGEYQLRNFQRQVRLWVMKTLNGRDRANPEVALGGKLGYVKSTLEGLYYNLNRDKMFLEGVIKERAKEAPELGSRRRREDRYRQANELSRRKIIFGLITHPSAKTMVESYRTECDRAARLRREVITSDVVLNTIEDMMAYVEAFQGEVARWEQALLVDATGMPGLFVKAQNNLNEIRRTHTEDQELKKIQMIFGDEDLLDDLGDLKDKETIKEMLHGVSWEGDATAKGVALRLNIKAPDSSVVSVEAPEAAHGAIARQDITNKNLGKVIRASRQRYPTKIVEHSIGFYLSHEYSDTGKLVDILYPRYFNTFFQKGAYETGRTAAKSHSWYIRVNQTGAEPEYFSTLIQRLRAKLGQSEDRVGTIAVDLVNSANLHKCTAIRTADCWFPNAFVAWHDCLKAFRDEMNVGQDVSLLHVYPAEANAVKYEILATQKLPEERGVYTPFHPRVVMLLDNVERVRRFFMCWVLGYIQHEEVGEDFRWELQLPNRPVLFLSSSKREEPDDILFRLLNNFVLVGRDLRPGSGYRIDDRILADALTEARKTIGLEEMKRKIDYHLGIGSESSWPSELLDPKMPLLPWLKDKAKVHTEERGATSDLVADKPEYWDLATLVQLMFQEEKEANLRRQASPKPTKA